MTWIFLAIGLVVGATLGAWAVALCIAADMGDDHQ